MGRTMIKIKDRFSMWSTISDKNEIYELYKDEEETNEKEQKKPNTYSINDKL